MLVYPLNVEREIVLLDGWVEEVRKYVLRFDLIRLLLD